MRTVFFFSFCDKGQERIRRAGIPPAETIATWGDVSLLPEGDLVPNVKLVDVVQVQFGKSFAMALVVTLPNVLYEQPFFMKNREAGAGTIL